MKNTFVLRINYGPFIEQLTDVQAGQLLKAIFSYVEFGTSPTLTDPVVSTAFKFIAKDVEYDIRKYNDTCARRAENGRIGGLKTQENLRKIQAN